MVIENKEISGPLKQALANMDRKVKHLRWRVRERTPKNCPVETIYGLGNEVIQWEMMAQALEYFIEQVYRGISIEESYLRVSERLRSAIEDFNKTQDKARRKTLLVYRDLFQDSLIVWKQRLLLAANGTPWAADMAHEDLIQRGESNG
jgi:hypothetical protein